MMEKLNGCIFIEGDELLERYMKDIWNKVSNSIKKELACGPIYNKKFLKTKIRSYGHEASDFHDKKIPEVGTNYTCSAVKSIDSALKKDENHYPKVFLIKYKYIEKEKK